GIITQHLGPAQIEPPPVPAAPVIQAPSAVPAGGSTKTFPAPGSTGVAAAENDTLAGPAPLESMPSSQVIALLGANSAASKSADSGPISLGLPLMGVPTASSTQSPETGVPAPAKAKALIWIGTLKSDYEA